MWVSVAAVTVLVLAVTLFSHAVRADDVVTALLLVVGCLCCMALAVAVDILASR